jgi:acyl-CoA thioesterase
LVDLVAELALDGGNGRYTRTIGSRWDVGGRAFGGYGAALALNAMTTASELPDALSLYVMFLNPLEFGDITFVVETLRRGRSVGAARATAVQGDREVLTATAWLSVASRSGVDEGRMRPSVTPEREPDRNWAGRQWPVLDFAERRGARYPESPTAFAGQRNIELWLRPTSPVPDQLFDVLVLDGHLLDAPLCLRGNIDEPMASLDLSVSWLREEAPPANGWRCLRSTGDQRESSVAASGSLSWGPDHTYAIGATQALTRRSGG